MQDGALYHQLKLGPWDNFIHLLIDRPTRSCAVVDPAWDAATILAEAERLDVTITHVLCTHSHFDHVDQVDALLKHVDVPVHMLNHEVAWSGFACENLVTSAPGDTIVVGRDLEITMMHTPGHTPGSTCYRVPGGVVAGDTLFVNGCGRCDFVGGDPKTMYATLRSLVDKLPGDTVLYPGHDYGPTTTATLDAQLRDNPYLRAPTVAEFIAHRMDGKTPNSPLPPRPDWSP